MPGRCGFRGARSSLGDGPSDADGRAKPASAKDQETISFRSSANVVRSLGSGLRYWKDQGQPGRDLPHSSAAVLSSRMAPRVSGRDRGVGSRRWRGERPHRPSSAAGSRSLPAGEILRRAFTEPPNWIAGERSPMSGLTSSAVSLRRLGGFALQTRRAARAHDLALFRTHISKSMRA